MDDNEQDDTIYALSSGHSSQATAVALIRISGPQASTILQQMCKQLSPLPPPRKAVVRNLFATDGSQLDQALVLWFPAPRSFTGEDCVELHCHGSRAVLQGVLSTLATCTNTRLAEPGEFTQRAWQHNKMNVLQVEALADLLAADTTAQRKQALAQLQGTTAAVFEGFRDQLVSGLAHAEAVIDFGDDELDESDTGQESVWGGVRERMAALCQSMESELSSRGAELVRDGVRIAIVGPPNAGKSSLFNRLADREAAIVSPQAGTTRDVLEVALDLAGTKCVLQDTAGVRQQTTDVIEQEGMQRALAAAERADLVVVMVDAAETGMVEQLLSTVLSTRDHDKVLLVCNKVDLCSNPLEINVSPHFQGKTHAISCRTEQGLNDFLESLSQSANCAVGGEHASDGLITRARHRQHVQAAAEALKRFDALSQQGHMAIDLAAEELRLASSELGRITGAVDVEDVLDKLFADFCIGK